MDALEELTYKVFMKPSGCVLAFVSNVFVRGDVSEGRFLPSADDPNKMLLFTVEEKLDGKIGEDS